MDAVLHVPNGRNMEHCFLYARQTRLTPADKTCSQLPSAFTLRIYT